MATDNFLSMENLQGFEGLSALEESAVRLHEIYKSLMTGGFTEDEALSLIAKMTKPNSEWSLLIEINQINRHANHLGKGRRVK